MSAITELPTRERHARFAAERLTRYSYSEIETAFNAFQPVAREYESLIKQAGEILAPHLTYPFAEAYLPEPLASLYKAISTEDGLLPYLHCGKYSEFYPVRKWLKQAQQLSAKNARIRKAINQAWRIDYAIMTTFCSWSGCEQPSEPGARFCQEHNR